MKAVIGRFYKTFDNALKEAEKSKRMWKGRCTFVVVGNDNKGYIVISESAARSCGIRVPLKTRRYKK